MLLWYWEDKEIRKRVIHRQVCSSGRELSYTFVMKMSRSLWKKGHVSPLRYPGGKSFLSEKFSRIIELNKLGKPIYIEPYAGGSGAALQLLFANKVKEIVINDLNRPIFSFWQSIIKKNSAFIKKLLSTPVTIEEWKKQKKIYEDTSSPEFDLGFATFFLNRTNVSGILNANPIGGINQTGAYKINARFNKKELANRIRIISQFKDRITVTNNDGIEVFKKYANKKDTFIYLDPPYFDEGYALYMKCEESHHQKLAEELNSHPSAKWILTYDEKKKVRDLYPEKKRQRLSLKYRATIIREARELMVFSDSLTRV